MIHAVSVVSNEAAEKTNLVICCRKGTPSPFVDNIEAECAACGHAIFHRPHRNKNYLADMECWFHAWQRGSEPVGARHDMHRYVMAPVGRSATYGHPTVKPDKVMDKIMTNVNGVTVCDPFMGTGSTGVAAIKAGKIFTGIEHNPKHFETAVQRIEAAWRNMRDAA